MIQDQRKQISDLERMIKGVLKKCEHQNEELFELKD